MLKLCLEPTNQYHQSMALVWLSRQGTEGASGIGHGVVSEGHGILGLG